MKLLEQSILALYGFTTSLNGFNLAFQTQLAIRQWYVCMYVRSYTDTQSLMIVMVALLNYPPAIMFQCFI